MLPVVTEGFTDVAVKRQFQPLCSIHRLLDGRRNDQDEALSKDLFKGRTIAVFPSLHPGNGQRCKLFAVVDHAVAIRT